MLHKFSESTSNTLIISLCQNITHFRPRNISNILNMVKMGEILNATKFYESLKRHIFADLEAQQHKRAEISHVTF